MTLTNISLETTAKIFVDKVKTILPKAIIYLTGSYATKSNTPTSDLDLIIITTSTDKKIAITKLKRLLRENFPILTTKLDCKVLTLREAKTATGLDYLFLYSSLKRSVLLTNKPLSLPLDGLRLREAISTLEEQLAVVRDNIISHSNFDLSAFSLLSVIKSLFYLQKLLLDNTTNRVITINNNRTVKNILGKDYQWLVTISNRLAPKGIQEGLHLRISRFTQKSGNFRSLNRAFHLVSTYFQEISIDFYNWFDHYY